ncbi:MAG: bifunctional diaminohydroxyphosphoribosylaminopyrimidine deaminase/5-amino-6-(5-phosphoribosylamino)uracil reductase RibD [Deltaproteobacteria bacterium]|jgi:diaminohydroxyphosphoribosylaminopyrimidine deaminase/5-amino-6-(5-phosphoribosylamino)uracil reductase|nr:bifunctional diaminohydroxyphosphoribosylaminopyrimidine deaminase/5-amino-6-(5-phosphoribosylamino)uracil reductase RibD [Deltaproteobacteria bacterium]MBW2536059.1 bifunctional diaminohydroxyphosphoribosylaminopyrimidine deaminase/5-amino-6-(5-phosphoribosylamino)uracil reductase RibD [Deltaproteobacteria bacterium]
MTHKADRDFDIQTMRVAIEQARMSRPSPNPPVGAVVVSAEGEVVAAAHHRAAGEEHAEVLALAEAGEAGQGGTLYATLEPCNHEGDTPPCVEAILSSGIRRVVIGCLDPNPHVEGGGAKRLEAAGLKVEVGVAASEAKAAIASWTKFITTGAPSVSLKLALSLDGRIATRSGASKWVTGPEARVKVQELRSHHDAVGVGIGTALADDPRLTVRDEALLSNGRTPARLIFDTNLRLPATSKLVETSAEAPTWILAGPEAEEEIEHALVDAGCSVIRVPTSAEGRLDMGAAFQALGERGIVSLLIEGGAELAGSLLAGCLADDLHVFIAPLLLGPRGRAAAVDWAGPDTPADAPRIEKPSWEVCGRDAYLYGPVTYPEKGG